MGEGLSGQDFAWAIYLVVYLLAVIAWLRADRREADVSEPSTRTGFLGWISRERWACGGALWGGIVWFARRPAPFGTASPCPDRSPFPWP